MLLALKVSLSLAYKTIVIGKYLADVGLWSCRSLSGDISVTHKNAFKAKLIKNMNGAIKLTSLIEGSHEQW